MSRSPALTAYSSQYGTEGNWAVVIHSAVLALAPVAELANTRQQRLAADTRDQPQWPQSPIAEHHRRAHLVVGGSGWEVSLVNGFVIQMQRNCPDGMERGVTA